MNLNINQTIALLAIARGTFHNELKMGTHSADLRVLGRSGLIERCLPSASGQSHTLTAKGSALVEAVKGVSADFLDRGSEQHLTVHVDANALQPVIREMRELAHAVHGNGFEPEPASGRGLTLTDEQDGRAKIKDGSFFVLAEADVTLERSEIEGAEADIKSISLTRIDPLVYGDEQMATDVAIDRAKLNVGSRHLVLKAVAAHEVAVPIKSTRL